ncbi:hypothetical protein MMC25_004819 [Agyrium rufum]|nr:hypothetical protein [Agyrium rufum]
MHFSVTQVAALALLLTPLAQADGLYTKSSPVIQVNAKNFDKLIRKSQLASIVEFYAPWCGHCKNLKPAYEKAAKGLDGLAQVAAVNCDDEENKSFCGSMGVKGFPTLKMVRPTGKIGKPIITDYQGARSTKGIVDAVKAVIPNLVTRVTDADLDGWLKEGNDTAKAILFTDKGTTSATIKVLAQMFDGRLPVAQIRDKDTAAVAEFGVTTFPTFLVLPGGDAPAVVYDGELNRAPMHTFLSQYAPAAPKSSSEDPKQKPLKKETKKQATKDEKKAAASDASTFSEASDSHATQEASSSAASATAITLEEPSQPTESPDPITPAEDETAPIVLPDPAPTIQRIDGAEELQRHCLGKKTGTCILALLPTSSDPGAIPPTSALEVMSSLAEIQDKHQQRGGHLFPFYAVPSTNTASDGLKAALDLSSSEDVAIVAVNGKRSWFNKYSGEGYGAIAVENWIDGIRFGEVKKTKIPTGLVVEAASFDDVVPPASSEETQASENTAESSTEIPVEAPVEEHDEL